MIPSTFCHFYPQMGFQSLSFISLQVHLLPLKSLPDLIMLGKLCQIPLAQDLVIVDHEASF